MCNQGPAKMNCMYCLNPDSKKYLCKCSNLLDPVYSIRNVINNF